MISAQRRYRCYLRRRLAGESRWGLYTNLWPTAGSRVDRRTLGVWYVSGHFGMLRVGGSGALHVGRGQR